MHFMKIFHSVSIVLSPAIHGEPTGCRLGSFDTIIACKREIRVTWDGFGTGKQPLSSTVMNWMVT